MINTFLPILLITENSSIKTEGGLFDFNATLPLMILQFLLLMIILNLIFYKPITNILDERDEYIRNSLTTASAYLLKADELTRLYEEELAKSRKKAQNIIQLSREEAQEIVSIKIKDTQIEAEKLISEASEQLKIQKERAIKTLEKQVDILSEKIKDKLLSNQPL